MDSSSKVYIALPALNELDYLPLFIDCLKNQSFKRFKLFVCINQPEDWWGKVDKLEICLVNQKSIEYLHSIKDLEIEIIDRSSQGNGWKGKNYGVGWARKTIMDHIAGLARDVDIIISLDADTTFDPEYFNSVVENFKKHPKSVAISIPYYHPLTGEQERDRAILRYEIYMRYFAINLWHIGSPYSFTAIGSAVALPVKSYKAIGGITPHKSGEDFYFLQKLRKYGKIITWNDEKVYPAARYSERVGFGTGPAMIKGKDGDWSSYPIYPVDYFDEVKATYDMFPELFLRNVKTPMNDFILEKFGSQDIWQPLRENVKTKDKFVQACHHKIDGFRIFQYLKWRNDNNQLSDEENLIKFMERFYPENISSLSFDLKNFDFAKTSIQELDKLRNLLVRIEKEFQKNRKIK